MSCKSKELKRYYYFYFFKFLFFDPGTQFPGNDKITLCNTEKDVELKSHVCIVIIITMIHGRGRSVRRRANAGTLV